MSKRPRWWLAFLAKVWPITWLSAQATTWPIVGRFISLSLVPLFSKKNLNISYIPINEAAGVPGSVPLPGAVVEQMIRNSSHRVIIERCTCRDAKRCENHPVTIGCTLLGEGTKEIDPRIARHVSVEEALDHFHEAVANGLIPMMGRVKIDNLIWGVRDRGKLLTVCYCCRCCCTILNSGKYLPAKAVASLVPLKGVRIAVDKEACQACGVCVAECFMGAIKLEATEVVRNEHLCKTCGRCVTVCPNSAARIEIGDIDAVVAELTGRIETLVDYR
ncbi:MAG: 4Fe-4S dicluster domain-containing protein [Smithellaceae bacterium]|nr:4Fe-4S dicluster domain-containing protein [Smithellaceae bacterium]